MKNIAFTICSNNYLSQAKVLSDSVYEYSRDNYDFFIVLCDVFSDKIDYSEFHAEFIEAKNLGISNFKWMTRFYNIIELNTAVKPFVFRYLYKKYSPEFIHYLDPDTCTYQNLKAIEEELNPNYSMLLTPHSLAPLPFDGNVPTDNIFLANGIYNLGFLGTRNSHDTDLMLEWWCDFLSEHCLINEGKGFFVDQLPMVMAPIFFHGVKVCYNKGINAAYWNLHERQIEYNEDIKQFVMDDGTPLIMYHFSNYKIKKENIIATYDSRHKLEDYKGLQKLFKNYSDRYKSTKNSLYKSVKCVYMARHDVWWRQFLRKSSNKIAIIARKYADYLARI